MKHKCLNVEFWLQTNKLKRGALLWLLVFSFNEPPLHQNAIQAFNFNMTNPLKALALEKNVYRIVGKANETSSIFPLHCVFECES